MIRAKIPFHKTCKIGAAQFTLPFRAVDTWVQDLFGRTVADCPTVHLANALADTLNSIHPTKKD